MINNVKKSLVIKKLLNSSNKEGVSGTIASSLLANIHQIEDLNSTSLADLCFTTQSSISKFIQKIGYTNFNEFKNEIIAYRNTKMLSNLHKNNLCNNLVNNLNIFSKNIINFDFISVVKDLKKAKRILIYASGSSYRALNEFYVSLVRLGYFVSMPEDFSSKYAIALNADENTYVICVSKTAQSSETIIPAQLAKNKGAKMLFITAAKMPPFNLKNNFINLSKFLKKEIIDPLDFSLYLNIYFTMLIFNI